MTRKTMTALFPALVLGLAAPALAQTATIRFHDLDLSSAAGRATLAERTETLARKLCTADAMTGTRISDTTERDACLASVRQQVAQKVAARAATSTTGG